MRKSLNLSEFIKAEILDEARLRDLSTESSIEKGTFETWYEFLYNCSVLSFSITGQQSQTLTREEASTAYQSYMQAFTTYENSFNSLISQHPEQKMKYDNALALLNLNKVNFQKAITGGTVFTPVYSNNPNTNKAIAQQVASGSATFNAAAFAKPQVLPRGVEPTSKRTAGSIPQTAFSNSVIQLNQ